MNAEKKAALADAVNSLIQDSDATALYAQMTGVIDLARRGIPVRLTGRSAILNPLVDLAEQDAAAFDRVMTLVDTKRALANMPVLETGESEPNRKAYMREFMAEKRARQRRLVELWNQMRSEHDKLRGSTRMEFERKHAERWQNEKDARIEQQRNARGRRLTREELTAISAQLWTDVDAELDSLEKFVRDELRKSVHARAPEGFKFFVGSI